MKLFTIITVCLNTQDCIRETIQSVLDQTTTNFEYIIKDGISSDDTVKIAQSFSAAFAERGISYRIISRKDNGIYDAMNQAIEEAQGQWILYLNAGDSFFSKETLETVERSSELDTADIVYGDVVYASNNMYYLEKASPIEQIKDHMPFCHQSVFVKKWVYEEAGYSTEYRICSDYLFFRQRYREGKRFSYLPMTIAVFQKGGVSSNNILFLQELIMIHNQMGDSAPETFQYLEKKLKYYKKSRIFHAIISRWIPSGFRSRRRKRTMCANGWKTEEEFFGKKKENP